MNICMTFSYVLHLAEVPLFAKTLNRIDLQFFNYETYKPATQLNAFPGIV